MAMTLVIKLDPARSWGRSGLKGHRWRPPEEGYSRCTTVAPGGKSETEDRPPGRADCKSLKTSSARHVGSETEHWADSSSSWNTSRRLGGLAATARLCRPPPASSASSGAAGTAASADWSSSLNPSFLTALRIRFLFFSWTLPPNKEPVFKNVIFYISIKSTPFRMRHHSRATKRTLFYRGRHLTNVMFLCIYSISGHAFL